MGIFQTKTYRCEWLAEVFSIDQYGKRDMEEKEFLQEVFPTHQEALDYLMNVTEEHPYSSSLRVYKPAPHSYYSTGVRYREVEVR